MKTYEHVNHPNHYNNYDVEVIEMMERIWGTKATILWCEMTAFKYRMRMGTKPNNSIEQDLDKEKWYLNKKNELNAKMDNEIDNWQEVSYIKDNPNNESELCCAKTNSTVTTEVLFVTNSTDEVKKYIDVSLLSKNNN